MMRRLTLWILFVLVPAAGTFPSRAACTADRAFFAPYSYIYTPGIVNGYLDSTITPDFTGSFWALDEGHPALQAGVDSGKFRAVDGGNGGWLTIRPRIGAYGYPPAIESSWNASSSIDGCIDTTGSDPAAPDLQQCLVTLLADQHSGTGYFAVVSAPADTSGNYDLTIPGDQPIVLAEIPRPVSDFDPYLDDSTNTIIIDPPQLDGSGLYLNSDCEDAVLGYRVYQQIVPRDSAPPIDRTRDDGDGVGWEVARGGQLPSGQPLALTQTADLGFDCAERSDVYLAFSLAFDSGYETPFVSGNHLQFAIDCCSDADGDGVCAEPGQFRDHDCDDANPDCAVDCTDVDLDQHCPPADCDDVDPAVNDDVAEVCDGVDNNCDGRTDETVVALDPVTLTGVASGAAFGEAIASLGDVDGDGYGDFIIGAGLDTADGVTGAGSATAFSGLTRVAIQRVVHPDPQPGDRFASALTRIGDVNVDGFDDILIGAAGDDTAAGVGAGSAFIYSGSRADGFELLHQLEPAGGASGDGFGESVAALDDVNEDGVRDVAVGVPGADGDRGSVLVFSGAGGYLVRTLTDPDGQPGDRFGCAVAGIGDLSGDGTGEILIGSCASDSPEAGGAGKVVVFSGKTWLPLATLYDPLGEAGDGFGESVARVPDVDGDGSDDVLVGIGGDDDPIAGVDAGSALLFSGATQSVVHRLSSPDAAAGDRFGARVADVGDLDGDGVTDVGIGAPGDDAGSAADVGSVSVFSSASGGLIRKLAAPVETAGAAFGSALAMVGNLDDDGVGDLVIGSPGADSATDLATGKGEVFSGAGTQDLDGDGTGDACDCAPQDPTAQALPPLLQDLALTGMSPTLLTWPDPGAGLRFDVVGGLLSDLRGDAGLESASCVMDNAPGASFQDNRPPPPAGDGYYYLPRTQNACGDGGYGLDSAGGNRLPGNDCP